MSTKTKRYESEPRRQFVIRAIKSLKESLDRSFRTGYPWVIHPETHKLFPKYTEPEGDPGQATQCLIAFANTRGIEVSIVEGWDFFGNFDGRNIQLEQELSAAEEFLTLAHELAHVVLSKRGRKPSEEVCELEAEAVAFVVSSAIGLDCLQAATDYIFLSGGKVHMIEQSAERISKASCELLAPLADGLKLDFGDMKRFAA